MEPTEDVQFTFFYSTLYTIVREITIRSLGECLSSSDLLLLITVSVIVPTDSTALLLHDFMKDLRCPQTSPFPNLT